MLLGAGVIVLTGIVGSMLIFLSLRVGNLCVLMEYVCKPVILVVSAIFWFINRNKVYDDPDFPYDPDYILPR